MYQLQGLREVVGALGIWRTEEGCEVDPEARSEEMQP